MQALRLLSRKKILTSILFVCAANIPANAAENTTKKIEIPVIENARIFAQFDDKAPAVVNYFTTATEQAVISFYQASYGEVVTQERKRGRLTVNYAKEQQQIRVVISQQNNMRQVDVIVDENN